MASVVLAQRELPPLTSTGRGERGEEQKRTCLSLWASSTV